VYVANNPMRYIDYSGLFYGPYGQQYLAGTGGGIPQYSYMFNPLDPQGAYGLISYMTPYCPQPGIPGRTRKIFVTEKEARSEGVKAENQAQYFAEAVIQMGKKNDEPSLSAKQEAVLDKAISKLINDIMDGKIDSDTGNNILDKLLDKKYGK